MYEFLKETQIKNGATSDFQKYAIPSGISGIIANIVTNPLWVIRTRILGDQMRLNSKMFSASNGQV
jgi:hypothetical protein